MHFGHFCQLCCFKELYIESRVIVTSRVIVIVCPTTDKVIVKSRVNVTSRTRVIITLNVIVYLFMGSLQLTTLPCQVHCTGEL